jgi:hypothetical protein
VPIDQWALGRLVAVCDVPPEPKVADPRTASWSVRDGVLHAKVLTSSPRVLTLDCGREALDLIAAGSRKAPLVLEVGRDKRQLT